MTDRTDSISGRLPRNGTLRLPIALLAAGLILISGSPACRPSPRSLATVSGKTVHRGMALEGVDIEVYRWGEPGWKRFTDTKSGYHGSFVFAAPRGTYRLLARTTIEIGSESVVLEGTLEPLRVKEPGTRIDRVVIELEKLRASSSSVHGDAPPLLAVGCLPKTLSPGNEILGQFYQRRIEL